MTLQANAETSKVQILESPRLAPGTCVLCGTSRTDDRQYIDIGLTVEYVGVIYFCTFCMTEVANRIGCYTIEQSKQLEDELDRARQRILEFETKDSALNDVITHLRNSNLFSDTVSVPLTVSTVQDAASNYARIDGGNSIPEQSDSEQRPDDVPSSSSNEQFLEFEL